MMLHKMISGMIAALALLMCSLPAQPREPQSAAAEESRVSWLLEKALRREASEPLAVIVRFEEGEFKRQVERGGPPFAAQGSLPSIYGYSVVLRPRQIERLAESPEVRLISLDQEVRLPVEIPGWDAEEDDSSGNLESEDMTLSEVSRTIGLAQRHFEAAGAVGVAVLDSGIANAGTLQHRVQAWLDFTSTEGRPVIRESGYDPFGHGTHVAGIVDGLMQTQPGLDSSVRLIDLRVLDDGGRGRVSSVIAAIDWIIENRNRFDIRVANLSLGHLPVESFRDDPLCLAVGKLVAEGVAVVASAGNFGSIAEDGETQELWGAISSPSMHPEALAVAAVDTRGSIEHHDDRAAAFASRGPSYPDALFKPDLAAPGHRVISLSSRGSALWREHPYLQVGQDRFRLSGSSMAAAVVSGSLAAMLAVNPSLGVDQARGILLLSAVKMRRPHLLEQGNGLVNAATSLRMAAAASHNSKTLPALSPVWHLGQETIWAGGAFAQGRRLLLSPLVSDTYQVKLWGYGTTWADGLLWADGSEWYQWVVGSQGVLWGDRLSADVEADGLLWADGFLWADGIIWGDRQLYSQDWLEQWTYSQENDDGSGFED